MMKPRTLFETGFVGFAAVICLLTLTVGSSSLANVATTRIILFGFDSSAVDPIGRAIIMQVASDVRGTTGYSITVIGHADRAGSSAYNIGLSRRRAEAVRNNLVASGVPSASVTVQALGESQPTVPTDDNIREATNRRVEILIEGGVGPWNVDQP